MKCCSSCKVEKPLNQFGKSRNRPDGLNIYCRECANAKSRETKRRNVAKNTAYNREYRAANRESYREWERANYQKRKTERLASAKKWRYGNGIFTVLNVHAKSRAKRKGWIYELDADMLEAMCAIQGNCCALTGVKFEMDPTEFRYRALAPSIDRIDSSKHYTLDNIQLTTVIANKAKNEYTVEMFDAMCLARAKVLGK